MKCLHRRHKQPRYDVWLKIYTPEYRHRLRQLPDEQICRFLLSRTDETRKVKGDLTITYRHPITKCQMTYDLSELAHVGNGDKVEVSPIIVGNSPDLLVGIKDNLGDVFYHQVQPVEFDEAGFRRDAPVIGDEYKSKADNATQVAAKEADKLAFPGKKDDEIKKAKKEKSAPFEGRLNAHSYLKDIQYETRVHPTGKLIEPDSPISKQIQSANKGRIEKTLDAIDLKIMITGRLGRGLRPVELDWLESLSSVTEKDLSNIVEQLHKGVAETPVLKLAR